MAALIKKQELNKWAFLQVEWSNWGGERRYLAKLIDGSFLDYESGRGVI
jgi:hypothetical protein